MLSILFLWGCSSCQQSTQPPPAASDRVVDFEVDDTLKGLRLALSDATPPSAGGDRVRVAQSTPLGAADTQRLLQRLPDIEEQAGDRTDFAMRDRSLPPPRAGQTVDVPFPPPPADAAPATDPGPVKVVRFAPEGDVPIAPHLSVTFNQPMVAVTSQEEAARVRPVQIHPEPPGQWRWVGAKTLLFEPDPRFPMATEYTVTVPEADHSFTFQTPPLQLVDRVPTYGPQPLEPLIFLGFDQEIDVDALSPFVTLKADNTPWTWRNATAEEIRKDKTVAQRTKTHVDGRWMVIRPAEPLPRDATILVTVAKGAPSGEGPRVTTSALTHSFRTYGPLKYSRHLCGYREVCRPVDRFQIEFTNPLDPEVFDASSIQIKPPLDAPLHVQGQWLVVPGRKKGRTTYTMTVPSTLQDTFGQTLGEEKVVSFEVGPATPTLYANGGQFVVLDPAVPPRLSVFSTNHRKLRMRAYAVGPEHWARVSKWWKERQYDLHHAKPVPAPPVADTLISIDADPDSQVETHIDLRPWLKNGRGQLLVHIEPETQPPHQRQEVVQWVQATDLGLTAFVDQDELFGWVTDLKTGAPVSDVALTVFPEDHSAVSNADGLGTIHLTSEHQRGTQMLVARKGNDLALLPNNLSWWSNHPTWYERSTADHLRWYVFDDRGMYRPGETVTVKGFLRRFEPRPDGDIAPLAGNPTELQWILKGPQRNEIARGTTSVSALGGFHLSVALPDTVNLGNATLRIYATNSNLSGQSHSHTFQIQEFRRPEFEVSASAQPGVHVLGHHLTAQVNAAYYAGGGLSSAPVQWNARSSAASYTPPNRDDYRFGTWTAWWGGWFGNLTAHRQRNTQHSAKTDAAGSHQLDVHLQAMNPPRPMNVQLDATVTDLNRQAWNARTSFLVHPSEVYVGLRSDKAFIDPGDRLDIDLVAVGIDGAAQPGREITTRLVRLEWGQEKGKWAERERDAQTCTQTAGDDAVRCSFTLDKPGSYRVRARVVDDLGRPNTSDLRVWVSGSDHPPKRGIDKAQVQLIPDKKQYGDGDTARILVQAPFTPAEGVLSLRRTGMVEKVRFRMDKATHTLEVPIRDAHVPNLYVQVDLVGDKAYASGRLNLPVPPDKRTLSVAVSARDEVVRPGGETTVNLTVHDAEGTPVRDAELAVVVADESVLSLSGYTLPDPLAVFYAARGAGVADHHLRQHLILGDPEHPDAAVPEGEEEEGKMGMLRGSRRPSGRSGYGMAVSSAEAEPASESSAPVAKRRAPAREIDALAAVGYLDADKNQGNANTPIAVRSDFSALALFEPDVRTDANGTATVALKVPDNLTRYRIMVVAAKGIHFGKGEADVTARNPLMVRPSPPRFLNFGDRFELPVLVQNQTDDPLTVDVAVRATNIQLLTRMPGNPRAADPGPTVGASGQRVTVAPNDRVEVRFPAAADMAGTARFQIAVAAPGFADAAEVQLPVWTPATSEAFATYGELDDPEDGSTAAVLQPVQAPPDVWAQFGGLEVTTSSTQLQALTDALIYLVEYPFECTEQLSSRIMGVAALQDVLSAFHSDGLPPPATLKSRVNKDLDLLSARQNHDGGFPFWRRGDPSWPYISIHIHHAITRATNKGYSPNTTMVQRGDRYLRNIERHIPPWYSVEYRRTLIAYALYVRHLRGDTDGDAARALYRESGNTGIAMEGLGWLLPVLHDTGARRERDRILRYVRNRTSETAGNAQFVVRHSDEAAYVLLHSNRRVDAVLLDALMHVAPKDDLIPKLVRGLLAHRSKGRWGNTQENAFVLVAMDRYFHQYEGVTPNFVGRVWLGDRFAGQHAFEGRTTERARIDVPMDWLTANAGDLTLAKEGPGRLYYRIGMTYAPKSLRLEPSDHGFTVGRRYLAVDDEADVTRDEHDVWHIRAGARIQVEVSMVVPARRHHVALVDPLPAGLEPLNPALAVTGPLPAGNVASRGGRYWWWGRTWYEHENLRDERVEAYSSLVWAGVHTYTYYARATTPGQYVVPPPKAEEMYAPETFGRGSTDRVVVFD